MDLTKYRMFDTGNPDVLCCYHKTDRGIEALAGLDFDVEKLLEIAGWEPGDRVMLAHGEREGADAKVISCRFLRKLDIGDLRLPKEAVPAAQVLEERTLLGAHGFYLHKVDDACEDGCGELLAVCIVNGEVGYRLEGHALNVFKELAAECQSALQCKAGPES